MCAYVYILEFFFPSDKTPNETFSVTCGNKTALVMTTADRSTFTSDTKYTYQNTTADISSETEHMHLSTRTDLSTGTEHTTLSTIADIFTGMKHISPTTTDNVSSRLIPVDIQPPDKESDITCMFIYTTLCLIIDTGLFI